MSEDNNQLIDGLKDNLTKYLRVDVDDSTVQAAIVYAVKEADEGNIVYGAYYGYAGGGENEGGFFRIDIEESEVQNMDFGVVDELRESNEEEAELLEFLLSKVWELLDDNDGEGPLAPSEAGQALLATSDDGGVYMDDDFDGDMLAEVSEGWAISLRFED